MMSISKISTSVLSVLTLISLGMMGFSAPVAAQNSSSEGSQPAIIVNGESVDKSKVKSRIDRMKRRMKQRYGKKAQEKKMNQRLQEQAKRRVIDQTVQQLVLKTNAEDADVSVSSEEVDKELQNTVEQFPSEDAFEKALKQEGMTKEQVRQQIRESLKIERFLEKRLGKINVTDEEARSFYENNKERFSERSFADVKSTIKRSLKQRQKQQQRKRVVSNLKEKSDIDIRI